MDIVGLNDLNVSKIVGVKILGLESALNHFNLSTVIARVPVFLNSYLDVRNEYFEFVKADTEEDLVEDKETGLYYTNPERTICDMIKYDRCEEFIVQALDDYLIVDKKPLEPLMKYARKYDVVNQMQMYVEEVMSSDEFY